MLVNILIGYIVLSYITIAAFRMLNEEELEFNDILIWLISPIVLPFILWFAGKFFKENMATILENKK